MVNQFSRTEMLFGSEGMKKLNNSRVALFGVGGVGGYTFEALVRSGIGTIDIFDNDIVSLTNLNRQIIATQETVGKSKVKIAKERALSINPDIIINIHECFYMPENANEFDFTAFDYIIDAIDTVKAKIELVIRANEANTPIISSMGTGNKIEASMLEVSDIYKTSMCPLAKTMRYELKKRRVKKLKVVYSKEQPIKPQEPAEEDKAPASRRATPGSTSFVPATAGLIIAGEVIKDLLL